MYSFITYKPGIIVRFPFLRHPSNRHNFCLPYLRPVGCRPQADNQMILTSKVQPALRQVVFILGTFLPATPDAVPVQIDKSVAAVLQPQVIGKPDAFRLAGQGERIGVPCQEGSRRLSGQVCFFPFGEFDAFRFLCIGIF